MWKSALLACLMGGFVFSPRGFAPLRAKPRATMDHAEAGHVAPLSSVPRTSAIRRVISSSHFERNVGQGAVGSQFLFRGAAYTAALSCTEAFLLPYGTYRTPSLTNENASGRPRRSLVSVAFTGASLSTRPDFASLLTAKSNYFLGRDRSHWRVNVDHYERVECRGVYEGVDAVFRAETSPENGGLEYDFVVAPGASVKSIVLAFKASAVFTRGDGALVVRLHDGELIQPKPVAYQMSDGSSKRFVDVSYVLLGGSAVGISVGPYDPKRSLVVDPIVYYSSYLGGSDPDFAAAVALDNEGNAYVTGATRSTNFPITPTAIKSAPPQIFYDGFLSKVSPTGQLIYSTYFGGSDSDSASGIAIDQQGFVYIVGSTSSFDFPVTQGAFRTVLTASPTVLDAYVLKLSASGDAILYSTLIGGDDYDVGTGIVIDESGNAYITGKTNSDNFPVTPGSFQSRRVGQMAAFLVRLNATATSVTYGSYLGGTKYDEGLAIARDGAGAVYVSGTVQSSDFPTTPNAFQQSLGAANVAAFVAKFNLRENRLVYSTYLGGRNSLNGTAVSALAVNSAGNAYVTGSTGASDFPVSPSALQTTLRGGADLFVARLNLDGTALDFSTYLGGDGNDSANAIVLGNGGEIYLAGRTYSSDFPVTPDALQQVGQGADAFLVKLSPNADALIYGTRIGGQSDDSALAIALDTSGNAVIVGSTSSSDFPITDNALLGSSGGQLDAFILRIGGIPKAAELLITSPSPLFTSVVSESYSRQLFGSGGSPPYAWSLPDGRLPSGMQLDGTTGILGGTPREAGTYPLLVQIADSIGNSATKELRLIVDLRPSLSSLLPKKLIAGQLTTVLIQGHNFQAGFSASVFGSSGPVDVSPSAKRFVDSDHIEVDINLPVTGATYSTQLTIRNPGGTSVWTGFTVVDPSMVPSITSVSPAALKAGAAAQTITITGGGFQKGLIIEFSFPGGGGTLVGGSDIGTVTTTLVRVTTTFSDVGTWRVAVRNPDGEKSNTASLAVTKQDAPGFPALSFSGLADSAAPAACVAAEVVIPTEFPLDIIGQATLSFISNAIVPLGGSTDAAFGACGSSGVTATSIPFTISAGSTRTAIPFNVGSVAGTLALRIDYVQAGADGARLPSDVRLSTQVSRLPPIIQSTSVLEKTSSGVRIQVKGISTTRELLEAIFTIYYKPGIGSDPYTFKLSLAGLSATEFGDPAKFSYGGRFTYTQNLFVNGDVNAISGVGVILINQLGSSDMSRVNF